MPATSVLRRISRPRRSCGFLDHASFQRDGEERRSAHGLADARVPVSGERAHDVDGCLMSHSSPLVPRMPAVPSLLDSNMLRG